MKKYFTIIYITFMMIVSLSSCVDRFSEEFNGQAPIYLSYEDLRSSVKNTSSRDIIHPGKIYFKDGYLFINEEMEGIHIIDNRHVESPVTIGFIEIPGNIDLAIKNNTLYADSYVDLVSIDISDIDNPIEISREKDVLPYTLPVLDSDLRIEQVDETKGVVVGWEVKKIKQEMDYYYYPYYSNIGGYDYSLNTTSPTSSNANTFGVGGSMARFGLYDDYLYIVDQWKLNIFDVNSIEAPEKIGEQSISWDVETMFIHDDHMFFGMQSGMHIYSLNVPTLPQYIGSFWHSTSCDPVVVEDDHAFITLRGGTSCGGDVNRLDVIHLSDNYIDNTLIASYPMESPYGLGIDDDVLFVCDGDSGLKVYDASDKEHIDDHRIASFPKIHAYDVIPYNNYLFLIGADGFYQYDYADLLNIHQVSHIPTGSVN